VTEFEDP